MSKSLLKYYIIILSILILSASAIAQDALTETYTDPENTYSLSYPAGWFIEPQGNVLFVASSDDYLELPDEEFLANDVVYITVQVAETLSEIELAKNAPPLEAMETFAEAIEHEAEFSPYPALGENALIATVPADLFDFPTDAQVLAFSDGQNTTMAAVIGDFAGQEAIVQQILGSITYTDTEEIAPQVDSSVAVQEGNWVQTYLGDCSDIEPYSFELQIDGENIVTIEQAGNITLVPDGNGNYIGSITYTDEDADGNEVTSTIDLNLTPTSETTMTGIEIYTEDGVSDPCDVELALVEGIEEGEWIEYYLGDCSDFEPYVFDITADGENLIMSDGFVTTTLVLGTDGDYTGSFTDSFEDDDGNDITFTIDLVLTPVTSTRMTGTETYSDDEFTDTCDVEFELLDDSVEPPIDENDTGDTSDSTFMEGDWTQTYVGACSDLEPFTFEITQDGDGLYIFEEDLYLSPDGSGGYFGTTTFSDVDEEGNDITFTIELTLTPTSETTMTGVETFSFDDFSEICDVEFVFEE